MKALSINNVDKHCYVSLSAAAKQMNSPSWGSASPRATRGAASPTCSTASRGAALRKLKCGAGVKLNFLPALLPEAGVEHKCRSCFPTFGKLLVSQPLASLLLADNSALFLQLHKHLAVRSVYQSTTNPCGCMYSFSGSCGEFVGGSKYASF